MREVGPARKVIGTDGDTDAAAPYMGLARTQLGILKNQMQLGQLMQGSRTIRLEDGAVITVASRFGQDSISVAVPATNGAVSPEVQVPAPAVETPSFEPTPELTATIVSGKFRAVGAGTSDLINWYPTVWNKVGQPVVFAPPYGSNGRAPVVARNGTVGVTTGTLSSQAAMLWTPQGGFRNIGNLGDSYSIQVRGVSDDASVVALRGRTSLATGSLNEAGYWTAKTGTVVLPGADADSEPICISGNGKIIAGSIGHAHFDDFGRPYTLTEPAYWDVKSGAMVALGNGPGNNGQVTGISRDGNMMVGYIQNVAVDIFGPTGQIQLYYFTWTRQGGMAVFPSQGVQPWAGLSLIGLSGDGATSAAQNVIADSAGFIVESRIGIWTRSGGFSFFGVGAPSSISPDGQKIVGMALIGGINGAAMWDRNGTFTPLGDPPGEVVSACTSVTTEATV